MLTRVLLALSFVAIIGVPLAMRPASPASASPDASAPTLVIVTPHVQQLQSEFGLAFETWHEREFGEPVRVSFRRPGGTSEIIRQLQAQYAAAAKNGQFDPDTLAFTGERSDLPDLVFGGGSYDHGRLKNGVKVVMPTADGDREVELPMSEPAGFAQDQLDAWYGPNEIGAETLYDPEQYWLGTALSSFGIVYNRDVLERLGLDAPDSFDDMTDPRLAGWIALADPRQSGSITTTFDSILSNYGWDEGWRILRAMTANTRYFTNSSTKPPIDVSQGEAAMGLAIDFYGRGQAQAVASEGTTDKARVGYADPAGSVYIDPDPVSLMRGAPNRAIALRFIEFTLSVEGQALWQFRPKIDPESASNPTAPGGEPMGPEQYALRRLPVRRVMYEQHAEHMMDRVDPFAIASETEPAGWRSSIGVMMGAFAIDSADEQREAWRVLRDAASDPGFPPETLAEMRDLFYAMPVHVMPGGSELPFNEQNYRTIRNSWRDPEHPDWAKRSQIRYTEFFRHNYRRVIELGRTPGA